MALFKVFFKSILSNFLINNEKIQLKKDTKIRKK